MGFFRGHKRRGSFDLFSSYNHFLPGLGGVIILVLIFGAGSLLGGLMLTGLIKLVGADLAMKYGMLIVYPITFIPALLYASVMSRLNEHRTEGIPTDKSLSCGWKGTTKLIFVCVFSTIATAFVMEPISILLPEMPADLKQQMELIMNGMPTWAAFISVSIFAPLFEEWLCRGLVLRGLLHKTKPYLAIIASAAFFALIHGNLWQAIPAFGMGLLFGYVYYKTGSLKLTMLMHLTNNTMALALSKVPQFKDAETFMDVLSPAGYWCIFTACILIIISALVLLKSFQPSQENQVCQHQ